MACGNRYAGNAPAKVVYRNGFVTDRPRRARRPFRTAPGTGPPPGPGESRQSASSCGELYARDNRRGCGRPRTFGPERTAAGSHLPVRFSHGRGAVTKGASPRAGSLYPFFYYRRELPDRPTGAPLPSSREAARFAFVRRRLEHGRFGLDEAGAKYQDRAPDLRPLIAKARRARRRRLRASPPLDQPRRVPATRGRAPRLAASFRPLRGQIQHSRRPRRPPRGGPGYRWLFRRRSDENR